MRQGQQQNRRGRGRNRSGKGGQSPLTRSFESNGPDVKIRGTPAHIAEKYIALARDSMSAGDPVLAENYLQHAEHYNRIIMAFREQQSPNGNDVVNGNNNRFRGAQHDQFDGDDIGDDEGDDSVMDAQPIIQPNDPQPSISVARERQDRDRDRGDGERQNRDQNRGDRDRDRDRRPNGANGSNPRQRAEGGQRSEREPRRRERQRFGESGDQPDFLRRPIRRTRREDGDGEETGSAAAEPAAAAIEESQD